MKWYHVMLFMAVVLINVIEAGCSPGCDSVEEPESEPEIPPATLIYPDGGGGNNFSRSPIFIWDGHLEEDEDGSFEFTLEIEERFGTGRWTYHTGSDTLFQFPDTLDAGTYYTWWVVTEASGGRTAISLTDYLNTGMGFNNPPSRVQYIYPPSNSTDIPTEVMFSWYAFDPDGDDITYDLWYRREQDSDSTHIEGLTATEYSVALNEGTTYRWHVTPWDEHGAYSYTTYRFFSTVGPPEGVFADLTLTRKQTASLTEVIVIDNIWARFDDTYAPRYSIYPLQPDAVSCGGYDLSWVESRHWYYYENAHTLFFLDPGIEYTFTVTGGGGVPSMTGSIVFPECAPLITSPLAYAPVSMDGFTVTWSGYDDFADCDRQVSIAILDMMGDSTGVYVTTDNDGSYTFTAGELSVIDPMLMDLQIVLVVENVENIIAPGYDPRSWIRARTLSVQVVYSD